MFRSPFKSPFLSPFKDAVSGLIDIWGGAFLFNGGGAADTVVNCGSDSSVDDIYDGGGSFVCCFRADSDGELDIGRLFDKTQNRLWTGTESGGKVKLLFSQLFSGTDGLWRTDLDIIIGNHYQVITTYNADATTNDPILYIRNLTTGETSFTTYSTGAGNLTEITTPTGTRDTDAAASFVFGNRADGAVCLDGLMYDVRLYDSILTAGDRALLLSFADTTTAPVAWWKCQETSGTSIADSAGSNTGTASGTLTNFFDSQTYF